MFGLGKIKRCCRRACRCKSARPLPPRLGNCAFAPIFITCSTWEVVGFLEDRRGIDWNLGTELRRAVEMFPTN
jgi:hypothetical protein